jgi:histone H3/H4
MQRESWSEGKKKKTGESKGKHKSGHPSYRLPKAPVHRTVRELIASGDMPLGMRIKRDALELVRTGAEEFMTDMFRDVQTITVADGKRITITPRDVQAWILTQNMPCLVDIKSETARKYGLVHPHIRSRKQVERNHAYVDEQVQKKKAAREARAKSSSSAPADAAAHPVAARPKKKRDAAVEAEVADPEAAPEEVAATADVDEDQM